MFEMICHVSAQDHLDNDLTNVPVLGFTQLFENVVLGVKEKFEGNCAMMVF